MKFLKIKQMRKLLSILMILCGLSSCTTYKPLVNVTGRSDIPDNTQAIILSENIDKIKEAFKAKGIMIESLEGGFKTEEILLDEGTRAMYKVNQFDNQVRITAFWGITQKVKSQMIVWAGADAASAYDVNAWDQVIYDNKAARPKRVFDYAVQILNESNFKYSFR
jgi:hypothetical protein